ncbi:MAG: phosphoribosylaminoimidazolecarboxamide formyltransferase [Sphaerochaetaceae bacterium]|nr:phosphoribosylaminoimidazolecarboxamide formyltransferase [Sphaerochaetaceae bacterium]
MRSLELKYGCNPNQKPARVFMQDGSDLPFTVLNGRPGYINLLDALNGWQLVSELRANLHLPAAASFKHVSPAGAAVAVPLTQTERGMYFVSDKSDPSPLAIAYIRARGADRMSSFGDFVSLSDVCDLSTAKAIKREVSDGIIAPGFEPEALALLKQKKQGQYCILQIDPGYRRPALDHREIYGITFEQHYNDAKLDESALGPVVTEKKEIPDEAKRDLIVAMVALKYTQSNSVCYAYHGQTIGVGAGQQSRIHCTRLAGDKADRWFLRQSERALHLPYRMDLSRNDKDNAVEQFLADYPESDDWRTYFTEEPEKYRWEEKRQILAAHNDVSLASDAFFPFRDNIDRAHRSGVGYIVQPGGSLRDDLVLEACNQYGMVMVCNSIRLFHH